MVRVALILVFLTAASTAQAQSSYVEEAGVPATDAAYSRDALRRDWWRGHRAQGMRMETRWDFVNSSAVGGAFDPNDWFVHGHLNMKFKLDPVEGAEFVYATEMLVEYLDGTLGITLFGDADAKGTYHVKGRATVERSSSSGLKGSFNIAGAVLGIMGSFKRKNSKVTIEAIVRGFPFEAHRTVRFTRYGMGNQRLRMELVHSWASAAEITAQPVTVVRRSDSKDVSWDLSINTAVSGEVVTNRNLSLNAFEGSAQATSEGRGLRAAIVLDRLNPTPFVRMGSDVAWYMGVDATPLQKMVSAHWEANLEIRR